MGWFFGQFWQFLAIFRLPPNLSSCSFPSRCKKPRTEVGPKIRPTPTPPIEGTSVDHVTNSLTNENWVRHVTWPNLNQWGSSPSLTAVCLHFLQSKPDLVAYAQQHGLGFADDLGVVVSPHGGAQLPVSLGQFWDNFGTVLRQFWDNFDTTLRQLWQWHDFGTTLG